MNSATFFNILIDTGIEIDRASEIVDAIYEEFES